jgi:hypothetical protein
MPNIIKLVFVALIATIALSFAISGAGARRIETSEQGFLVRISPIIWSAAGNRLSCPLTLEGSFHSRILSKVCGQLIGHISQAQIPVGLEPPCQGGTARALTETLPWHVQYVSFAGRLPAITQIRFQVVGARFQTVIGGVTCLAGGTQAHPGAGAINIGGGGEGNSIRALPEFTIPLGGEFICGFAGNGTFEGSGEVFTLRTPQARITVRLVQ